MSYILEALKKSELERQQGKVPDLTFAPTAIGRPGAADAASRRPYLIAAAVLLAGAAALAWWRPWQAWEAPASTPPEAPPSAPLAAAPTAAAPRAPVELPVATPRAADVAASDSVDAGGTDGGVPAAAAIPPAAAVKPAASGSTDPARRDALAHTPARPQRTRPVPPPPAPIAVHKVPAVSVPPAAVSTPAAAPVAVVPESVPPPQPMPAAAPAAKSESAAPVAPKRVLNFTELPPAVRKSVARIDIAGYSYSEDPQARMVVINDRILHEGEEVVPGVRLEKIGSDGIVLSHKGIRFRP